MQRLHTFLYALPLLALLTGFMWSNPTWEEINTAIDRQYPTVENIDVESLKTALDLGQPPVLIDVREEKEYAVSHLPHAVNLHNVAAVTFPKDTPLVIYCSVGVRSAAFAKELKDMGFSNIRNLRGSIFAWGNKNYPLWRGNVQVRAVHPYNKRWGTLLNPKLHMFEVIPR
jgi:rhodanese-related sulfurtransferase